MRTFESERVKQGRRLFKGGVYSRKYGTHTTKGDLGACISKEVTNTLKGGGGGKFLSAGSKRNLHLYMYLGIDSRDK